MEPAAIAIWTRMLRRQGSRPAAWTLPFETRHCLLDKRRVLVSG